MDYKQFLRNRITSLRLEKGISEYQLSLELGKCKTYIQAISSGKSLPSFDVFFDLCEYFNITPDEFFAVHDDDTRNRRNLDHKVSLLSNDDIILLEQLAERLLSRKSGGSQQ